MNIRLKIINKLKFESNLFLVKLIKKYGEKNIPLLTPPPVVLGEKIPFPIVTSIPDFYVQEFYPSDVDPYPGYIQWQGMNGDYIYTLRTQTDYPFATSDDAVIHAAQVGLAKIGRAHV